MVFGARAPAILRAPSTEGRITKAELAARTGLLPTPRPKPLRRLEPAGLIPGCSARIDLGKIAPLVTAFVAVEPADHGSARMRTVEAARVGLDEGTARRTIGGATTTWCRTWRAIPTPANR